ncbi:hypothetical protein CBS101457_003774 [Exobasidium rhododendri]|nr:hypothetical protein CBS101457_003774 [Exobasidium rhododendri]
MDSLGIEVPEMASADIRKVPTLRTLSQTVRNNGTKVVAAPLPRSAQHAVTLASLVGDEDDMDELSESEIAQAQEAYSRAMMSHRRGHSGSTPPPAPSSGKGLNASTQHGLLWSPALSSSTLSNPSSTSFSSSTRPMSSSTRNSFSSIGPSSSELDRSSWGTRPSSIGVSSRRQEAMPHLRSTSVEYQSPTPCGAESSIAGPSNFFINSSKVSPPVPNQFMAEGAIAPSQMKSTTQPPEEALETRYNSPPSARRPFLTASSTGSSSYYYTRSPSPIATKPLPPPLQRLIKGRFRSASHLSEWEESTTPENEIRPRKNRIGRGRSSSWQPDWPSLPSLTPRQVTLKNIRATDVSSASFEDDSDLVAHGQSDVSRTGRSSKPEPLPLLHSNHHKSSRSSSEKEIALKPSIMSAPAYEGDLQELDYAPINGLSEGRASLHGKTLSLGNRRKSIDFAVKTMGRLGRRKNSSATLSSVESIHDTQVGPKKGRSHRGSSVSGSTGDLARLSTSSFYTEKDWEYLQELQERVLPMPWLAPTKSHSPAPTPRRFSTSSSNQRRMSFQLLHHPLSSGSSLALKQVEEDNVKSGALEEMHRPSSRRARMESLDALSGAFKKMGVSEGQSELDEGPIPGDSAAASTAKGVLKKVLREIPLVKKRTSQPQDTVASEVLAKSGTDHMLTPTKSRMEEERNATTPTPARIIADQEAEDAEKGDEQEMLISHDDALDHRGKMSSINYTSSSSRPKGGLLDLGHDQVSKAEAEEKSQVYCTPLLERCSSENGGASDGTVRRVKRQNSIDPQSGASHIPTSPMALLAKRSYTALVNAFSGPALPDASSTSSYVIKASGEQQQQGENMNTANGLTRGSGATGNGVSGGGGGGGGGGDGDRGNGWSGQAKGDPGGLPGGGGGNGGNNGRAPGGGGKKSGRGSPPIESIFRRLELVGRGAYGAVYRGTHVASGVAVALKVVNLDTPEDDVSDIQKEVALLSQLRETSNKNVVKYWGCWLKGSELWIVMDFADGGSIRTLMKAGPIAEKYATIIVRESLVALSYLHKSGIIHRDIKAANILLTTSGKVLLCDFGVAASLVSSSVHSKRSTFVGTPYWMAPEVITQGKTYDQSADIWSLGITVYEMVTGNPPLSDQEQMRAIMLIPKSRPPRLPTEGNFSPLLREFVGLCLNEEPKERPVADELTKSKWIKASSKVPNLILKDLIASYAAWTKSGGMRMSLIGAEANELNDANNRDSFAFDGRDFDEGWEFNTVNSRNFDWQNDQRHAGAAPYSAPAAPLRDHPLLRLFHGENEEASSSSASQQVNSRSALTNTNNNNKNNVVDSKSRPLSSSNGTAAAPTPTYMGADIRQAPLPPGPIPDRPPLATLTSGGVAVDKGSFTGMGATPFRFGKAGGDEGNTSVAHSTFNVASSSLRKRYSTEEPVTAAPSLEDMNGMNESSFGFHSSAGTSSANTSFSAQYALEAKKDDGEEVVGLPYGGGSSSAPLNHHQRGGSGLSTFSSKLHEGNRGGELIKPRQGSMNHSRSDSLSHYSHSRDRSEATSASASVSASLASEKRTGAANMSTPLLSTPLPLHRSANEATRAENGNEDFSRAAEATASTNQHSNVNLGYVSQRAMQMGARSRSGSRSRPMEGPNMFEHDWNNHGHANQHLPPLPNRNAAAASSSNRNVVISPVLLLPQPSFHDNGLQHQRRQHGGSDPTQLLTRTSREMMASTLSASPEAISTLGGTSNWKLPTAVSGAPPLRALDFNTLVERKNVHLELERTVEDLGLWLDVVGSGLARMVAKV